MLLLPNQLLGPEDAHRTIKLKGCTVVESCFYEALMQDEAFLADHELIYILSGKIIISALGQEVELTKGEAVLIKKGQLFEFTKIGGTAIGFYESLLFFIKPKFIKEFIQWYDFQDATRIPDDASMLKLEKSPILDGFMISLLPYFNAVDTNTEEVLRLKTFELLLHLTKKNSKALNFLLQLQENGKMDLVQTMDTFYLKNLSLAEFASLSGRSLAAFKRDFGAIFDETPAKWLKRRRLEYANTLLRKTNKTPSMVYLEAGFEDYAHFSRSFKAHFGISPSQAV
ncbi:MAG: AraC family transcriptional regulator [Bacteroidota bacterium]